jgi:hypothetical protein
MKVFYIKFFLGVVTTLCFGCYFPLTDYPRPPSSIDYSKKNELLLAIFKPSKDSIKINNNTFYFGECWASYNFTNSMYDSIDYKTYKLFVKMYKKNNLSVSHEDYFFLFDNIEYCNSTVDYKGTNLDNFHFSFDSKIQPSPPDTLTIIVSARDTIFLIKQVK